MCLCLLSCLQLVCTVVAILLHYFFLSTFAWLLVQGLHLYRMQVEPRNVDRGAMRFYHTLGWGVPAVLLGEALPTCLFKDVTQKSPFITCSN